MRPQAAIRLAPCFPGSGDGQPQAPVGRITSSDTPQTPVPHASVTWPLRCTPAALCALQHPGPQHPAPQRTTSPQPLLLDEAARELISLSVAPPNFSLLTTATPSPFTLHHPSFDISYFSTLFSRHICTPSSVRLPSPGHCLYLVRALRYATAPSLDRFPSRYVMDSIPMPRPISHRPSAHSPRPRRLPGSSQLRKLLFV